MDIKLQDIALPSPFYIPQYPEHPDPAGPPGDPGVPESYN